MLHLPILKSRFAALVDTSFELNTKLMITLYIINVPYKSGLYSPKKRSSLFAKKDRIKTAKHIADVSKRIRLFL